MNIRRLDLEFINASEPESTQLFSVLYTECEESERAFENPHFTAQGLVVDFRALDDPKESIFETFEPPPALAEYFKADSRVVEVNAKSLEEISSAAFGTLESEGKDFAANIEDDRMIQLEELRFTKEGRVTDIGWAIQPKVLKGKGSESAQKAWYNGFDVRTERAEDLGRQSSPTRSPQSTFLTKSSSTSCRKDSIKLNKM